MRFHQFFSTITDFCFMLLLAYIGVYIYRCCAKTTHGKITQNNCTQEYQNLLDSLNKRYVKRKQSQRNLIVKDEIQKIIKRKHSKLKAYVPKFHSNSKKNIF